MKTILCSGSAGFLGRHLVKYLREKGYEVVGYDLKEGQDILNFKQLHAFFETHAFDAIFHLAAQAFVKPGEQDPYMDLDVNAKGMINMLRCVEEFGVPMVFSSSGAVYGMSGKQIHFEDVVCRPTACYGVSKRAAELYLIKWVLNTGIDAKIVRFSSVYGVGRKHGPVNIFINKAVRGQPLTVFGDGSQTRDLIHVRDACRGMETVMHKGVSGEIYNLGGSGHSVAEVAEIIHGITGVPITYVPGHEFSKFDVKENRFNSSKARNELGFMPEIGLEEGIRMVLEEESSLLEAEDTVKVDDGDPF